MWTALITGLAALAGAAIGGLVTVWATHKTNVAAAERERAQRLHDHRATQHADAAQLFSSFYGVIVDIHTQPDGYSEGRDDDLVEMAKLFSQICVLHPEVRDEAARIMKRENFHDMTNDKAFLEKTTAILKRLNPTEV